MSSLRRLARRASGGQSLVEFALVLPLLILVMVGVFDAGRAIYAYNTVSNAARAGARVAIVNQDSAEIRARAKEMGVSLGLADGDIALDGCGGSVELGCSYEVRVRYVFTPALPFIDLVFPNEVSSTAVMTVEHVNP